MKRSPVGMLVRAVALTALLFSAVDCAGCSCDDETEYTPDEACDQITSSVNDVLSSCGAPAVDAYTVCGEVCLSFTHCQAIEDVEACSQAIQSLECSAAESGEYEQLSECAQIFGELANTCSSDDDDDWDDWDD